MARTLIEAALTSVNARGKLPSGVHWRAIDPDVHLGYRKGLRGGTWLVRWRSEKGYRQKPLGTADDVIRQGNLDFIGAVKKARDYVTAARSAVVANEVGLQLTVALAVETYVTSRNVRHTKRVGRLVRSDTAARMGRYVLGQPARGMQPAVPAAELANVALHQLTESDLSNWYAGLPTSLKDSARHRVATDLKAALNKAFAANKKHLDPKLTMIIKDGLKADPIEDDAAAPIARESQILADSEVSRLIRAAQTIDATHLWEGDLFRLVTALAATGARFSQIARMRVTDCQPSASRFLIPRSRKGKGKAGTVPVPIGRDVLDVILPAIEGRGADEFLFTRWRHEQVPGMTRWERAERGPWRTPSELARPWQLIRDHAGMPHAIPYALRHSSIVRSIRNGLPIRLVAAIHDTSVQMIETHYSRWIADGLEDLVVKSIVPLVDT